MEIPREVLGAFVPAAVSAALLAAIDRPWRRVDPAPGPALGGALAIAVAYAAGHALIAGVPSFPPTGSTEAIGIAALAAGAAAIAESRLGAGILGRWIPRVAVASLVPWLVLRGALARSDPPVDPVAGLLVCAVLFLATATVHERAARAPGPVAPIGLVLAVGAASALAFLQRSALLALLAGALASALAPIALAAILRPSRASLRAASLVAAPVLSALLLASHVFGYAETPLVCALLVAFAPACAGVADLARRRGLGSFAASSAALAVVGAALGGALVIAAVASSGAS